MAAPALQRIGFSTQYRTSDVAENLGWYLPCTESTAQIKDFEMILTVKMETKDSLRKRTLARCCEAGWSKKLSHRPTARRGHRKHTPLFVDVCNRDRCVDRRVKSKLHSFDVLWIHNKSKKWSYVFKRRRAHNGHATSLHRL